MLFIVLLLLFNGVNSKLDKESSCLQQVKCSEVVSPRCVRVKTHGQVLDVLVLSECEIRRLQCTEGQEAIIVPMKHCHYAKEQQYLRTQTKKNRSKRQTNGEYLPDRVINDRYMRDLGFMLDLSFAVKDVNRREVIMTTVKQIAEEAVKEYKVTFFAFGILGDEDKDSEEDDPYEFFQSDDITEFLSKFKSYTEMKWYSTPTNKPDYCYGDTLSPIRRVLNSTKASWSARDDYKEYSHLYVFTHNLVKGFRGKMNPGNVKVTFVLMPDCIKNRRVRSDPGLSTYYNVAADFRGEIFRTRKDGGVAMLTEFVRHTALAFEPKVIRHGLFYSYSYIPISVDPSVAYLVVSLCGSNVNFAVIDATGNKMMPEFLINTAHSKVYRFVALPPHTYEIKIDKSLYEYGNFPATLNVVTSKVDFTFQYRFSKKRRWRASRRATKLKYLIIYVTDKRNLVDVNKIKFIELDEQGKEDVFATHTLIKIAENVYATEYKIVVPTHDFFLVAAGVLKGTTKEVDSREVKYKPSDHASGETSSEETETNEDPSHGTRTTTRKRTTRPTFRTSTCSMWPE